MINDIAILVVSFDGYSDVWPVFFKCKETYWKDCPYKTYLVTNNKDFDSNCFVIKIGDEINWCDRLEDALKSIEEKDILLLLEDYLIGNILDSLEVSKYFDFYKKQNARYMRLIDIPRKHNVKKDTKIYSIFENEEYGINLQPAIWNKKYLMSILTEVDGDRSAWEFEISLLKKTTNTSKPIEGCFGTKKNVLKIHNGILKGKWFKNEVKYFKSRGIIIDTSYRGLLPDRDYFSHLIRRNIRETIPPSARKSLKKILIKLKFKFVSHV